MLNSVTAIPQAQRNSHIARIGQRNDPRLRAREPLIFDDEDMKDTLNAWKRQPETWMKKETLEKLKNCLQQGCLRAVLHSLRHSLLEHAVLHSLSKSTRLHGDSVV